MRGLTEAEARVIGALLGAGEEPEQELLARADLSRSTYQDARRRAYGHGWVSDRYIPNPASFGYSAALFLLAVPYADRASELVRSWVEEGEATLVWAHPHQCFGVFFRKDPASIRSLEQRLTDATRVRTSESVTADLTDASSVPVYFDLEGAWSHLSSNGGTRRYPRPLVTAARPEPPFQANTLRSAADLVTRPIRAAEQGSPWRQVGPFWLPRTQRKLVQGRHLNHRTLLNPGQLEEYQGKRADQAVFVTGKLREGGRAPTLLQTLNRSGAYPWLLAAGGGRVLIGLAAQRDPPGPNQGGPVAIQNTLSEILSQHLEGMQVVRESFSSYQVAADHRYDRLFR